MPGTGPKVGRGMWEYRGTESKVEGCDHSGTVQAHRYHPRLPDPLPAKNSQLQLSLATQTSCFGKSREEQLERFDLCPLIADNTGQQLDCPRNRLGNAL